MVLGALFVGWLGIRATILQLPPDTLVIGIGLTSAASPPTHAVKPSGQQLASVAPPAAARDEMGGGSISGQVGQTGTVRGTFSALSPARLIERVIPMPLASSKAGRPAIERELTPPPEIPAAAPYPAALRPAGRAGWSGDGWLLLRHDTIAPVPAGLPSYGRSQAGAVLRYRFGSAEWGNPQAHIRANAALIAPHGQELAAGLSARVLPRVPVRVALEARVGETDRHTRFTPAAYAVTEIPPVELPLKGRGEVYLQGGYVGGEGATGFVDGQVRIQRSLRGRDEAVFTAGVGAWGGKQKGAARIDFGPTASHAFRLGQTQARLSVDYRFRVSGKAEPKSGPALTLSAGF
jgi:hypothetical protein